MNESNCRVCGSDGVLPHSTKNEIAFDRCPRCGYVAAAPMPSPADLSALYGAAHFASSYDPEAPDDRALLEKRKVQYVEDRDHLLQFVAGGRLLDYGCGNGLFLGTFPDAFEKHGYELNPVTTQYLRRKGGVRVHESEAELESLPPGFFDVITMRGVIEHLIDPDAIVAMLASKLRTGGHFYICATPNIDSPAALVYGTEWNQFTPPYHLHYFSPRTLALVGARHGLGMIETRTSYASTPYAAPDSDMPRFLRDSERFLAGDAVGTACPSFPGTMMSLVFRKIAL